MWIASVQGSLPSSWLNSALKKGIAYGHTQTQPTLGREAAFILNKYNGRERQGGWRSCESSSETLASAVPESLGLHSPPKGANSRRTEVRRLPEPTAQAPLPVPIWCRVPRGSGPPRRGARRKARWPGVEVLMLAGTRGEGSMRTW